MANKDDINISNSYDDFGDFDFNIDESGTKRDQVAQPSKIRSDYIPAMKSGFVEGLKRELASKMPYTAAAIDQVSSIYNEAKQVTQQFAAEATPLVRSIGRSTNRLMPLVRPFMPKSAYDKITGKLSQIPDEQGELSEEEKQAQQISADINAAFQGSDANAQVRANMENVIGGMRHKATMGALSGLLGQMQTTNKFLTTSLMAYMKKDLELQYRQLYTQRDIASSLRGTAKVLEAELKNITHNTGLPDMIKAKDFQRRTTKREKLRDHVNNFWKNMMGNFKNNVLGQIRTALEGVEMAASGGADMKEMMEEMEGKPLTLQNLIMKGLFRLGGSALGSKVVGKVAKMGQVAMGGFDSIFENFGNNLIRGAENYARKDTLLGRLFGMFVPQRPQNDTSIQNALSKNPTQPVQFDISTREAIVTIIPGYLAKLNKLVEDIKDPKTEHEELVYSTDERRFVSKTAINETAEGIIDKFLNPEVYGSTDHLAVITTGKALHGRSGKKMREWFENTAKDSGGRTNRQLVERFFQNLVRSEDHLLDVEALDAYLNNKDVDASIAEYVQMATDGLGKSSRRIVSYILNSLKDTNGNWNATAIRKYQKALDNASPYYEVNAISEKFSVAMNDMSEEKRERIFAILEDQGLYDRKEGKLNLSKMNEVTANKRSQIDIGDAVNSWTARRAVEDITRAQAFTVSGVLEHGLDSVNGFMTNVANDAKKIKDKTTGQLKDMMSKGQARMGALTGNFVRSVFGDEMTEAFKLMSGALIDRYKKANGAATIALDLALVSGEFSDSDLQIVRDFAEQSMKEKDSEKITQMRIGAIGAIENEDLRNIFAEATSGILTKKDAVNHFGTMKQRINMLQEEEVFKQAQDTLKAKLTNVKDKGKSVKDKAQKGFAAIKNWVVDVINEGKKGALGADSNDIDEATIKNLVAGVVNEGKKGALGVDPEDIEELEVEIVRETKRRPKSKAAALAEAVQEKAKAAGKSISEAMDDTLKAKADVNEVLVKGLDEYKVYITTMDENVARIYTLLEKKLGNLSEEELTELHEKAQKVKDELQAKQEEATAKKKGSFGKKLKGFLGGAIGALNPFKALNAAKIAAKYQLDSTPESAFHADFQTYFAYRKEMDVCMASLMSRKSIIANTARGLLSGAGKVLGGTARGLGYAAKGLYTAGGKILGGALPALGYLGGGLIHGGAIALNGIKDLGLAVGSRSWELMKKSVGLGTRALFKRTSKPTEQWYDLYRKDEVGEENWITNPILSARKQKKGIFHIGPDGKSTGLIMKTDDIAGPVMDKKGKQLITQEDWDAGLVNVEGKSIAQKAKEHSSNALIQIGGGHSLLGGLAAGLGSFLGGGLKGAGSVLAKMMGINWDITKMFGSGLKKAGGFLKGLGSNLAASLGIGTSEKAQRKKYSVIIGEFEKVNKTLAAIKEEGLPTKKKKVKGDKDGDGDRDGSYEDQKKQEEEKNEKKLTFKQRLLGLIGREEKDGKIVKKDFKDTWMGKTLNWIKNPKNWIQGALLAGAGVIVGHFVKKYGAKKVIETVTDAIIKTAEVTCVIAQGVGWIVDKCIDIWKWIKEKFGFTSEPTAEQLGNMQNLRQVQNAVHAFRPGGGLIKGKMDPAGFISRPKPKPKKAPTGRKPPKSTRIKPKPQKAPRVNPGSPGAAGVPGVKPNPHGSPKPRMPKGADNIDDIVKTLDKVDDAGDAGKTGKPMLKFLEKIWTKAKAWCAKGSSKVGKYFDKVIRTLKVMQAKTPTGWFFGLVATVFGADPRAAIRTGDSIQQKFTGAAKAGGSIMAAVGKFLLTIAKNIPIIGIFVRLFAFIGKMFLWVLKVIAKAYAWIMDKVPELMGVLTITLVEFMDKKAEDMAYKTRNDNYMTEYWQAEHEIFGSSTLGWGMAGLEMIDMVNSFTARFKDPVTKAKAKAVIAILWLTYQGGRWLRGQITNVGVAQVNAIESGGDAIVGEMRLNNMIKRKITRDDFKRRLSQLHSAAQQQEVSVEDQEEHSSGWWNVGGHIGEAWTNASLESTRIRGRKVETERFITEVVEALSSNKYLPEQQCIDLMNLLEICIKQQGYCSRHPWGVAVFDAIRSLAGDNTPPNELLNRYRRASDLVNGKAAVNGVQDEALQYVWGKCKLSLKQIEDHINGIILIENRDRDSIAEQARIDEQRRKERIIRIVDNSTNIKENKHIAQIDDIFKSSKDTGITVDVAYENANVIFIDHLKDHDNQYPANGVYEYGNAVFVVVTFDAEDATIPVLEHKKFAAKYVDGYLSDKYKAVVRHEVSKDGKFTWACKHNDVYKNAEYKELVAERAEDTKWFYMVLAFKKTDIVPAPITTRANTDAARAATPQGNAKKTGTHETPSANGTINPNPVPDSLKPKSNEPAKPNRKAVVSGNVLLPCEGETVEEYKERLRITSAEYEENTGRPLLDYYADGVKAMVLKRRKYQIDNGQEPDGVEVKGKDGNVEIYAETIEGATARIAEEKAAAEAEAAAKKKKETPASTRQPTPPVTPASAEKKSAPEVRPESMTSGKKQSDVTDLKPGESWQEKFNRQQGELDALKAMLVRENPVVAELKRIAALQSQGNDLAAENGKVQAEQRDVFGRALVGLKDQKPVVVVNNMNGQQQQPTQVKLPNSPLNLQQGASS